MIFSNSQKRHPAPKIKVLHDFIERAVQVAGLRLEEDEAVALNFLSARKMRQINCAFLGHDYDTDVISFDYRSGHPGRTGDLAAEIFICPDMAERYSCANLGTSYHDEMALYIVHGLLHAAGELDSTPEQISSMRRKEKAAISRLKKVFAFEKIFPARKNRSH